MGSVEDILVCIMVPGFELVCMLCALVSCPHLAAAHALSGHVLTACFPCRFCTPGLPSALDPVIHSGACSWAWFVTVCLLGSSNAHAYMDALLPLMLHWAAVARDFMALLLPGVWTAQTPHCDVLHVRGQVMTALAFASAGVLQLFMDASSTRISVAWQVWAEGSVMMHSLWRTLCCHAR
jgi:hypothetical protein